MTRPRPLWRVADDCLVHQGSGLFFPCAELADEGLVLHHVAALRRRGFHEAADELERIAEEART